MERKKKMKNSHFCHQKPFLNRAKAIYQNESVKV